MCTVILSIVSFVCVILAAVCGYLFATLKARQTVNYQVSNEPAPVARPVTIVTPEPAPVKAKEPKKASRVENPAPVASPAPVKRPKNTPVKADVQNVLNSIVNCGEIEETLRKEAANFKMIFSIPEVQNAAIIWSMPDTNHILMQARDMNGKTWAQKEDIKNGGRRVTVTENGETITFKSVGSLLSYLNGQMSLEEASRGKSTKAANEPKDEPAPVQDNKPAPKAEPKKKPAPKTAPKNEPKDEPKNFAPVNAPAPKDEPKDEPAPVKKSDILAAIANKINNGETLAKPVACNIFKKDTNITEAKIAKGGLFFVVDNKERKASDVYFSTKACADVLANMKPETKDVQPVSEEERYNQNAIDGIIRTLDNKNISAVTFKDGIVTEFTQVKTGKKVEVEIIGFRRAEKGIYLCIDKNGSPKSLMFNMLACALNNATLKTLQKQINAGIAKNPHANAEITYTKSVA